MNAIEACHQAVHDLGCVSFLSFVHSVRHAVWSQLNGTGVNTQPRIASDIRIGTRTDAKSSLDGKVRSVEEILRYEAGYCFATGDERELMIDVIQPGQELKCS